MPIILKDAEVKKGSILYTRPTVISKCLLQSPRNALGLCLLGLASTDAGGEGDNSWLYVVPTRWLNIRAMSCHDGVSGLKWSSSP